MYILVLKHKTTVFQAYLDCACVQNSFMYKAMMENKTKEATETTTISMTSSTLISNQTNATAMPNAFQGICPGDCKLIWVVVPLLFIGMLMTFTTVSPTQTATLRYCRRQPIRWFVITRSTHPFYIFIQILNVFYAIEYVFLFCVYFFLWRPYLHVLFGCKNNIPLV